ncbi:MAG: hypothetical protein JWM47_986, partial [Acidimicrobiales bacterium]|nr:hypothetical protein [Acidimicrobiales bacterium]
MNVGTIPVGVSRPALGLVQGTDLLAAPDRRVGALRVAVRWVGDQQWPTMGHAIVGPRDLERWVEAPAAVLAGVVRGRRARAGLAALQARLRHELANLTVVMGDVHGEVRPGRWWFTAAADEIAVVDGWRPVGRGLPEIDVVLLLLAARSLARGSDANAITTSAVDLLEQGWSADETVALGADWASNATVAPSTLVLLAWLQGAAAGEAPDAVVAGRANERREIRALLESFAPEAPVTIELRD